MHQLFTPSLASHLHSLSPEERTSLNAQIQTIDPQKPQKSIGILAPLSPSPLSREKMKAYEKKGKEVIASGKMAAIILAGGQGSRLGFSQAKGCFPIGLQGESLFEKLLEPWKESLNSPLAIVCSENNRKETEDFFHKKKNFALKRLSFCSQASLPLVDAEGKFFLSGKAELAKAPDGNGKVLETLSKAGILKQWEQEGVEYIQLIAVDNVLANALDPRFLAFHIEEKAQISLKAIPRSCPEEKLGLFVQGESGAEVCEYSQAPPWAFTQKKKGVLSYLWGNITHFCFSLAWAKKAFFPLPLHLAYKKQSLYSPEASFEKELYKREFFIFDLLPFAERISLYPSERDECFAPLKSKEDISNVQNILRKKEKI